MVILSVNQTLKLRGDECPLEIAGKIFKAHKLMSKSERETLKLLEESERERKAQMDDVIRTSLQKCQSSHKKMNRSMNKTMNRKLNRSLNVDLGKLRNYGKGMGNLRTSLSSWNKIYVDLEKRLKKEEQKYL